MYVSDESKLRLLLLRLRAHEPIRVAVEIIFPIRAIIVRVDFTRCQGLIQKTGPIMDSEQICEVLAGDGNRLCWEDILRGNKIRQMELLNVVWQLSGKRCNGRLMGFGDKYVVRREGGLGVHKSTL